MTQGEGPGRGPVRPATALAFSGVGFAALMILGLGLTTLATGQEVIQTSGLGQFPGLFGPIAALGAFAGVGWSALSRPRPSFWSVVWIALCAWIAYLAGVGVVALLAGADPLVALGTVGRLATTWFGTSVAAAALVAGWAAIALVRTRARRPQWPWEHDDEE